MKIFLSSLENGMSLKDSWLQNIKNMPFRMKYNLVGSLYNEIAHLKNRIKNSPL